MHRDTHYVSPIEIDHAGLHSQPSAVPLFQTATFRQSSATEFDAYDYSRSGNPTRAALEHHIAALEHGRFGFAFASGMAAISTVARLLQPGDSVVIGSDCYGGTQRLFSQLIEPLGIDVRAVAVSDLAALQRAITADTRLVFMETPTNPLQEIGDIQRAAHLAHQHDALLAVDNTFLSPHLQNPLDHGADIVVHSATKHLGGHGDVTAGCIVVNDAGLAERIAFIQNAEGTALGPFDCWLLLRGMRTLGLRLDRQQASAERIARELAAHRLVRSVHYAGLDTHPGAEVQRRQARGGGCVISIQTGDFERSRAIVEHVRLFSIAVSFGSIQSTISLPCTMSHASIPPALQKQRPLTRDLVRLSIGIEHVDDLLDDLLTAFDRAAHHRIEVSTSASAPSGALCAS